MEQRCGALADLPDKIARKIECVSESGCWIWMGSVNREGYGNIFINGQHTTVHRVVYAYLRGPIPPRKHCDHLCRVTCCVNPDHIDVVEPRINYLRGRSFSAKNAAKTHCRAGHHLDGDNLYIAPGRFKRVCRECNRLAEARYRRRKMLATQGGARDE